MCHEKLHPLLTWLKSKSIHTNPLQLSTNKGKDLTSQLGLALQACSTPLLLPQGRQVHTQFIVNGFPRHGPWGAGILRMYVLCDKFSDAKRMFYNNNDGLKWSSHSMPWNWMIRGCNKMGWFEFALLFYFKMLGCGVCPDKYTFPPVIKACCRLGNVGLGRMVHGSILEMGYKVDVFVGSALVKLYVENGYLGDARRLFNEMPERDCVLCNVMLHGLAKFGEKAACVEMFKGMGEGGDRPDCVTFTCILSVCASEGMIECGTQLHGLLVKCGMECEPLVTNTLLTMYAKCRMLSDARKLFELMPRTSSVPWTGMITGYVQNGFMNEALSLFCEMISTDIKPDSSTFASFIPSLSESGNLEQAKEIHGYMIRHSVTLDVFLTSALIDVYSKCRDMDLARKIFYHGAIIDMVSCTAMISGYVLNGMNLDAVETFRWLLQEEMIPNALTFTSILPACARLAALRLGKELHGNIVKNGLYANCHVGSAVLDMYAKCGRLDLAHNTFRKISSKDSICWNSIITSCSQNGKPDEAIDLFREMGMEGMNYNCVSISAALSASANLTSLHYGKELHAYMIKNAFTADLFAESALIDMYGKCGNLSTARRVFNMMQVKNEVPWNSMIAAYGYHGHLEDCLSLFHCMLENQIQPDCVSFLSIISACGHVGRVDDGIHYFHYMTEEYGILPRLEHYACLIDLFGRAGCLEEAFDTIKNMPFSPDAGIWGTLLGACRLHGNVELAEVASRNLHDLDPANSGYYMLLSNMHADSGQWGNALKIRSLMKERGVQKVPGYSWIEVNNSMNMFVSADGSHPQSVQIFSLLRSLLPELKKEGYLPQPLLPMHP